MDSFDLESLNTQVFKYQKTLMEKINNLALKAQINENNLSNQSDLLCMILDYSPKLKDNLKQQSPQKYQLKSSKPSTDNLANTASKSVNNEKNQTEDSFNSEGSEEKGKNDKKSSNTNKNTDNKDINKSKKTDEDKKNSFFENLDKFEDNKDNNTVTPIIKRSTEKKKTSKLSSARCLPFAKNFVRELLLEFINNAVMIERNNRISSSKLLSKGKIRVYVLRTQNFFEMDFKPEENLFSIKKRLLNKLENTVNISLKFHNICAYEFLATQNDSYLPEENENIEPLDEDIPIFDLGIDTLCFVEVKAYTSSRKSILNYYACPPKKLYGNVVTNTSVDKINVKIYIKLDANNISSTIIEMNADQNLKDVFLKVSHKKNFHKKNLELYYFTEHSDNSDNDDMDNAINLDISLRYLAIFELDLYFKKFPDNPSYMASFSFSKLNFSEDNKNSKCSIDDENIMEYFYNDTSAGIYQEFPVIKINRLGTKQERLLGIDMYNIYNEKFEKNSKTGVYSRKKTKNPMRKIKDVICCGLTGEKSFYIEFVEKGKNRTIHYETKNANLTNEIISKLKYLIRMRKNKNIK